MKINQYLIFSVILLGLLLIIMGIFIKKIKYVGYVLGSLFIILGIFGLVFRQKDNEKEQSDVKSYTQKGQQQSTQQIRKKFLSSHNQRTFFNLQEFMDVFSQKRRDSILGPRIIIKNVRKSIPQTGWTTKKSIKAKIRTYEVWVDNKGNLRTVDNKGKLVSIKGEQKKPFLQKIFRDTDYTVIIPKPNTQSSWFSS